MNSTLKTLTVLASGSVAALAVSSGASAITLVQTQTFQFDPDGQGGIIEIPTLWQRSASVGQYAPGGLVRVEVELSGTATSSLTAEATTTADAFILNPSRLGASISTSSTLIPDLNVDVLPVGDIPGLPVQIPGGTTQEITDVSGADQDLQVFTSGLGVFEGGGTFDINLLAIGSSTLTTGGGNLDTSQTTVAGAELIVRYFVEDEIVDPMDVPEPGMLLGLATIAGAGFMSRRRKS
ncbi:choice-of-anchor E domain-containing protein [Crocosphaera sp.]|uniref:choice-of-anchor E domain-containing protein n=1 Tax=Crocosphaera sp. TaxID=2729996 RepID=UPI003F271658|nr:choice-of-anchor E domain-containing protein [Crocosphaera sp.]